MTAILFDIDDTLYDQVVPFGEALREVFPHLPEIPAAALFAARSHHGEKSFRMALNQEMTMEEMYRYRIQKAFEDFDVAVSGEEAMAFQRAYEKRQKHLALSPVMEELLSYCQEKGAVLGVISNGPADHQREKAETLGLLRFMPEKNIIVSGAVGCVKPDIRIFRLAEKRLGLIPEETWYVGDSYENDMAGASQAGWHTLWLNRRKKPLPDRKAEPELCVCTDEELFAALRRILEGNG